MSNQITSLVTVAVYVKNKNRLGVVVHDLIPVLGRHKQVALSEFEANLSTGQISGQPGSGKTNKLNLN